MFCLPEKFNVFLILKVKVLIWNSPILYLVMYSVVLYNLIPHRELTQPWCESSPWGDSDQHAAYIPSRASASAVLPYVFAGTHFTYPHRDGRLSQPLARLSGYWTQDLSHDSLLLYQLSYPSPVIPLASTFPNVTPKPCLQFLWHTGVFFDNRVLRQFVPP